jgi:hypothetical protein
LARDEREGRVARKRGGAPPPQYSYDFFALDDAKIRRKQLATPKAQYLKG